MKNKKCRFGVLVNVSLLTAALLLCGIACAAEGSEETESEVKAAIPILAVFPLEKDGIFEKEMQNAAEFTELYFSIWTPDGIGVAPTNKILDELTAMAPWDPDKRIARNPKHLEKVIKFYGGTHIVTGTWAENDGMWAAHCILTTPDAKRERDFEVPEGNDIELAWKMAAWILEEMGWPLEASQAKYFEAPIFGPEIVSTRGDLYKNFIDPLDSEVSTQVILADVENYAAWYWFLLSRWETHQPTSLIGQMTDKLKEEGKPAAAYLVSGMASRILRGPVAGAPGYLRYLHAFPNTARHATFYIYTFQEELMFERFVQPVNWERYSTDIEKWSESAADTLANKAYLSLGYGMAGSGWRGTKGWSALSMKQAAKYKRYRTQAVKICEELHEEMGGYPWVTCNLLAKYYESGLREEASHLLDVCKQEFPDYVRPWDYAIHYARPRWGGSHREAFALVDEAMDYRLNNGAFGKLAYGYCVEEALKETGNGDDMLLEFARLYPKANAQLRQGAQRTWDKYNNREGAAFSYTIAALLGEREIARQIAAEYPDFPEEKKESFANLWFGRAWFCMLEDYFVNGQWDALVRAQKRFNRYEFLARHIETIFSVFMSEDPAYLEAYTALAKAMSGNYAEAEYTLDTARTKFAKNPWMMMLVEAVANPDAQAAYEGLVAGNISMELGPQANATMAIAAQRAEKPQDAKEYIAKLPEDWKCDVPAIVQEAKKVGLEIHAAPPIEINFLDQLDD
ncbi:hypothetical protein KQI84_05355 [bacterium]|nr:hypothetical protein [bacterium]